MLRSSALCILLLIPPAVGRAQDCNYDQALIPKECVLLTQTFFYNRGLQAACDDAGGALVSGDPRPVCRVNWQPWPGGAGAGNRPPGLAGGNGMEEGPGIATILVPGPGIGGGAGREGFERFDIPWNEGWSVTLADPDSGNEAGSVDGVAAAGPGIVLPPGAIFIPPASLTPGAGAVTVAP